MHLSTNAFVFTGRSNQTVCDRDYAAKSTTTKMTNFHIHEFAVTIEMQSHYDEEKER